MKYLITGGTGFIGRSFCNKLLGDGHELTILSRKKDKVSKFFGEDVKAVEKLKELPSDAHFDVVVNLAGEGIANKRWSESQKRKLLESRINVTKQLIDFFERVKTKPSIFISASAIGYYGSNDHDVITETSKPKNEFTHQLCHKWEQEALRADKLKVRTCIVRLGVVLGEGGGTLAKMGLPFKLGLGGKIGNGKQYFSWVHMDDVISAFEFLIKNEKISGIFNLTSPNAVTNSQFTKSFGSVLNRFTIIPMPSFVVKTLFGEMGETLLLSGQRVFPKKLTDAGFDFKFQNIDSALSNIYN